MNTLIVKAHPASYGFTHKIAETYKETKEKTGGVVEVIDLYDKDLQQPFLCFEDIKTDCGPTDTKTFMQEKIMWADELVFVSPVWQMGVPATMKNYFDVNFTAGFAFKYTQDGLVQLLKDKKVRFFLTADGPAWLYWVYCPILKYLTLGGFLHSYSGAKISSITAFTRLFKKRNDPDREKMLNKVRSLAWQK